MKERVRHATMFRAFSQPHEEIKTFCGRYDTRGKLLMVYVMVTGWIRANENVTCKSCRNTSIFKRKS